MPQPETLLFEWDSRKGRSNARKHGVGFAEASTVFGDSLERTIPDPYHSEGEHRFLSMGNSDRNRLLVVSFVERGSRIRILSARRATAGERQQYESGT